MWFLYILLILLILVSAIILYAVLPGRRRDTTPFDHTLFAHRGLHSGDSRIPENSLPAFLRARDAGYGVELDVQLTSDKQVVVFHDDNLQRVCGLDRRVDELTYAELQKLRLFNSEQTIPLLSDVLTIMEDTTVLCEFKTMRSFTDTTLCEIAYPILAGYKGAVCVESFNPMMMRWFRRNAPHYIRGILGKRFDEIEVPSRFRGLLSSMFTNFLCRPDFIAYSYEDRTQPFFRFCRLFGPMTAAWTITSPEQQNDSTKLFDTVIFEGYLPQKTEHKTFLKNF